MKGIRSFFTRDKISAFAIHLSASLAIFLILLAINLTQWYPQPLFKTDGGWNVLRIVIFVDVVLGPLLTLIVYRQGKPRVKFDMSVIILCQLIALVAGGWISYNERPVYVALDEGQLTSVSASLYQESGGSMARLRELGRRNTRIAAIQLPESYDEQSDLFRRGMNKGIPVHLFSETFVQASLEDFRQPDGRILELNYLQEKFTDHATAFREFRQRYADADRQFIFAPFRSRYRVWAAAIDRQTLKLVDVLDIRLFQEGFFEQKGAKVIMSEKPVK